MENRLLYFFEWEHFIKTTLDDQPELLLFPYVHDDLADIVEQPGQKSFISADFP
jgi:hypothetical protein